MQPSVRPARTGDVPALAGLRWRWRVEERGETGMDLEEFTAAFAEWVSDHAASHIGFVAESAGTAIGMAWLALVERVPGPGRWTRTSGYLQSVYVAPEHRGGGAGSMLVAAAVDAARAAGMDYVAVHPSERSFSLYRRAGFTESAGVLELRWSGGRPSSTPG